MHEERLLAALRLGKNDEVRALLPLVTDITKAVDPILGLTALHLVCLEDDPSLFKELIDRGAHVDARDHFSRTPLMGASFDGQEKKAQLLIDAGADIDACDRDRQTALHKAVISNKHTITKMLYKKGACVTHQIFVDAITTKEDSDKIQNLELFKNLPIRSLSPDPLNIVQQTLESVQETIDTDLLDHYRKKFKCPVYKQKRRTWYVNYASKRRVLPR